MKKITLDFAAFSVASTGGVAFAEPSFSVTGMLRQEIANNTGGANKHTSWGSPFNGKAVTSHTRGMDKINAAGISSNYVATTTGIENNTSRDYITPQEPECDL